MIYGQRIRFRAVERRDLDRFTGWLNDPEVRDGLSIFLPLSGSDEENWFEAMSRRPAEQHPFVIEIQDGADWRPVGNCGYNEIDWPNRSAEVGIFIGDKSAWNHGYGTEAMRLLLDFGFNRLNLHRIFLRVHADNRRAVRAYEKAGFQPEGCLRDGIFKGGQYVDVLLMSVLRPEWQAQNTSPS